MKHIIKQSEPRQFIEWKAQANDDWQPSYDDLRGEIKKIVKKSLMEEQGYICCYCEQRLSFDDSHIEHFKPQHDPKVDALDYSNILCSCQDRIKKGDPRHCGNLKDKWFDESLLVSPLESSCESRFRFNGDGTICAADAQDIAATTTINKLGLHLPILNDARNKAIEPFLDDILTEAEREKFIYGYLQKDSQGMLGEFWTTIQQLFGATIKRENL
jgi:uncharacterized protein (TIGR02646 family)